MDAKLEPQVRLAGEVSAELGSVVDLRPRLDWHIEGDTVVFHLSPELCFHLSVPTSPLQ